MRAEMGDQLHVHGRGVARSDETWEIIGVRGPDRAPSYLVRRGDGDEVFLAGPSTSAGASATTPAFDDPCSYLG